MSPPRKELANTAHTTDQKRKRKVLLIEATRDEAMLVIRITTLASPMSVAEKNGSHRAGGRAKLSSGGRAKESSETGGSKEGSGDWLCFGGLY